VVSSCHAADVPFVRDFESNPVNHVCIYGRPASIIHARSSSRVAERDGTKTLSFNVSPTQKRPGVLNQAIVVATLFFHHAQSKQLSAV
jgi:hypothetical protein